MKIVAGIIGAGIGLKHLDAIHNYKKSKVKIICEFDKKKISLLKKRFPKIKIVSNEKQIFNDKDINLVSIASYDQYHYSQIIKCIKFKKHIIVEKPMCLNQKQLIDIIKKLKKNRKIKIFSNLVLRVNKFFINLKKKINKKNLFYLEADYIWGRKWKLFEWRAKEKNYSLVLGAGIHMIDLVNWLTDSMPLSVFGYGSKKLTKNTKFKKNSFVIMIFKYPRDIIVKVTANAVAQYNHFHEIKLFEKNKTFVSSISGFYGFKNNKILRINYQNDYPDKKNRKKLIQNFLDNILTNKKPLITKDQQFNLMKACFAANESLKSGKEVKIKYS